MISFVFFERLEPPLLPTVFIVRDDKEMADLLARFEHVRWWQAKHLDNTRNLVELARSWKDRQAQEKLDADATH